jgi:dihydroflavonol-4-reductase
MQADPTFWAGRRVCVTGGSGFLGFHLVQTLRHAGARARAFGLRPAAEHPLWSLDGVEVMTGDVRDVAAVRRAVEGCSVVFHAAGLMASLARAAADLRAVHLEGTRNVLEAIAPGTRLVHTSSVVTVGATCHGEVLDEDSPFTLDHLDVPYVHAKRDAEMLARVASGRRDVVIVNPGYLVGPVDYEPSVMGRLCLRAWKGRILLVPPGGLNLVDVRDVAAGQLLAAQRGRSGRRYILGGENLSLRDLLRLLAQTAGHCPRLQGTAPGWLTSLAAYQAEWRAGLTGSRPSLSRAEARVSRYHWYYNSDRARRELGYAPRCLRRSLADALAWHRGCRDLRLRPVNAWLMRSQAA